MSVFFYILKLSVCLIIVWLFYQLVLRRLTFYAWNRWYLVVCTALAFLLPLINIAPVLDKNNWTKTKIVSAIPRIISDYENVNNIAIPEPTLSERLLSWLPYIVVIGALAMLVRLLFQYFSLLAMRRSSQLLLNGPVKVYQVNKPVIPFSFGNAIYLNQHLHEEEELKEIIRHEFIHVKQRHTIDIIWGEAICILTWYNPFSWLLRKAIRQNLEFIADQQVLKTGLDRRQYQYLLLKVIGVPTYSIASNFNFKSLKKRIAMMNKVRSARVHLVRFLLLLPVVAIILLAFRNVTKHRQLPPAKAVVSDTIPGKKFPDNVRSFHTVNNRLTVTLKDGKMETYNLDNDDELAAFEKKYGKLPEPPTPPIPPIDIVEVPVAPHPLPHAVPLPGTAVYPAPAPVADVVEVPATPYQDDCYNDKGYCIAVINTPKGRMVMVASKNKKEVQLVYLEDWQKDKKYEEKFGKLPLTPPDAPPPPHHAPTPIDHMPEGVSQIHVKDFDAVVTKADGKVERYDLRLAEDKSTYHKKYSDNAPYPQVAKIDGFISKTKVGRPYAEGVMVETPVTSAAHATEFIPGTREIIAVIKNNMSAEDIDKLKIDLKVKGYTLTLSELKHENGKITLIDGKIKHDSHSGHFRTDDFDTIIISREHKTRDLFVVEIRVGKNKEEQ